MKNEHKKRLQRLPRLLRIIMEVKTAPRQTVPCLTKKLGISKTQYYELMLRHHFKNQQVTVSSVIPAKAGIR